MKHFEQLEYVIPLCNMGQIVEISYACDENYIYERSYDRSNQTTVYARFEHPDTEGEFEPWNGEPKLGDPAPFTKKEVEKWETVGTYVYTFPSDDYFDGACDVEVQIGEVGGTWFIRTQDDAGGSDDADDTGYASEKEARKVAEALAQESTEGEAGENAASHLKRKLREAAEADLDPEGEFCVYYDSPLEDAGPRERYRTEHAAEAAAVLANMDLTENQHSTNLRCGFEVRRLNSP